MNLLVNFLKKSTIPTIMLVVGIIFTSWVSIPHGNTIFSMRDKTGDEYGAGDIKYPSDLEGLSGLFDITLFEIEDLGDKYAFSYTLKSINNDNLNKNNFSHVLIDTYISIDDNGLSSTSSYGAAITFNSDYPWKYRLRISPEEAYLEVVSDNATLKTKKVSDEIKVSVNEYSENEILAYIPKDIIAENLKEAKYYVFTGGYDIFGSDKFRTVSSSGKDFTFSGGINSLYQPNVIDVVSPIQEKMLVYFMPPTYASISPIYNQIHQRLFTKEMCYILIVILFIVKEIQIAFSLRRKKP